MVFFFSPPCLLHAFPPPPLSLYPQSVSPTVPTAKRTGGGGFFSHSLSLSLSRSMRGEGNRHNQRNAPACAHLFLDVLANEMRGLRVIPTLEPMGSLGGDVRQGRYLFLEGGRRRPASLHGFKGREEEEERSLRSAKGGGRSPPSVGLS